MSLPPASAACFLPPPEPVCFSSRTIASHRGSHPREVLFCPLPCTAMPRSPLGDAVGSWTPGGQAGSSDAGISSALAPRSVGGTPGARPGRGLWKALCVSWPLCLLPFAPPPPHLPRLGLGGDLVGEGSVGGGVGGGLCRVLQVAPDPGLFGAESLQPAGACCSPPCWLHPFFPFLLSFSQFI